MRRDGTPQTPLPELRAGRTRTEQATMNIRTRKLIGTVLLLGFIALYALAAMLVAIILQVNASKVVELAFYTVAGLAWVIPAGLLVRWMQRPDPETPPDRA
jgi:hypothetical protein